METVTLSPGSAIRVENLSKHYGDVQALTALSLTVPVGSIYGFLGPNGAGKTTTLRLILGFSRPTSGTSEIFGAHCWSDGVNARNRIGYLVPADALYPDMNGIDQLDHAARLSGQPPVLRERVLDSLGLEQSALERKVRQYSRGMRQKLALTAAMQHDPDLLILDEPTEGLDPLVRRNLEGLLRERNEAGRTIFMSSHDLTEVERLCEYVAIVRGGRLVAEEQVATLKSRQLRRVVATFKQQVPASLRNLQSVRAMEIEGNQVTLLADQDLNPLLSLLHANQVVDLMISAPTLDEIFSQYYRGSTEPELIEAGASSH